ncbi:MAG TPA: hypothetical protein VLB74_01240 [Flavobacterium sp.]|uniref:hypothetical protein n=1 Tax=Flavobacterium sp. TaxID=239 RepID=UPI002BD6E3D8|nr:hypothetical protein [Flavobacterium sp.]HSD13251.1 hypothetical protein [Flavobacterium sp.]
MKTKFLFPHRFKKIGWLLFIPFAILSLISLCTTLELNFLNVNVFCFIHNSFSRSGTIYFGFVENNITDEILMGGLIIGGLLTAFSKEKNEDEMVEKIRLESLVWATYFNYAMLLISIIFIYGESFFTALLVNIASLLIFFIVRFNWMLYKTNKISTDEE